MTTELWLPRLAAKYLKAPTDTDNKYSRGVLSCIAGSRKFPGAALLATESALSTGVGMVRFSGSRTLRDLVVLRSPEIVTATGRTDAYLLGPGVPPSKSFQTNWRMHNALQELKPTVIDAGALNLVTHAHPLTLMTPHAGEMAQLLTAQGVDVTAAAISEEPGHWARECALKFDTTVLLKGHITFLANPHRTIAMPSATARLATAGTGDVLAGILGGLLAINHELVTADNLIEVGATAVAVHTEAARLASQPDDSPLLASQLHGFIPQAIHNTIHNAATESTTGNSEIHHS